MIPAEAVDRWDQLREELFWMYFWNYAALFGVVFVLVWALVYMAIRKGRTR